MVTTLKGLLKPGDAVYTILRHVARSGMYRVIDVYLIKDNKPLYITHYVADVIGSRRDRRHGGIVMTGTGMDMGFSIVYELSRELFDGQFVCVGDHCPSNDHSNGDNNYAPHAHSDAGYALRHEWLR